MAEVVADLVSAYAVFYHTRRPCPVNDPADDVNVRIYP